MGTQCQHLTMAKCNELPKLLQKFDKLFDGTLGTWTPDPVYFKLKEDENSISSQPCPLPKVSLEMLKEEFDCLVLLGVLEVVND